MTLRLPRMFATALAVALASASAYAQPTERDHRAPPPPPGPTERDHRHHDDLVGGVGVVINANVAPPAPGGAPPPPPPGTEPVVRDHRNWHFDRPIVSSYWPTKGKPGRKIVIRGENFPADAMVMWGGTQITGAKVTPTEIVFEVPATAASGEIFLKRPHGRDLAVGQFEVAASFDA